MVRAVLDTNVVISALLAPSGSSARLLRLWLDGAFELVVSPKSLAELDRILSRLDARVERAEAVALIELLRHQAEVHEDPSFEPPVRAPDPGDDYLIALAAATRALIVTADRHLLDLAGLVPVCTAPAFLGMIEVDTDPSQ